MISRKEKLSVESLLSENAALTEEAERLRKEKADLELMMEMNTEHSDSLEEELLERTESVLRESEKRFRLITETIPVPIMITRLSDSTALYVNEQMASLLGLPTDKLIGSRSMDFFYENPSDREKLLLTLEAKGCLENYEIRGKKAGGKPFWVALFTQPLTFNDEPCLLSALYDLTERKQAEEEIRRLQEELENRIKEREGKYLTFGLAGEEYGVGILKVREIIAMTPFTPVPRSPDFVKGVINLRGKVIPVTDLRLRFGLEPAVHTERTCIIVVEISGQEDDGKTRISAGVVVDSVSEVLNIRGKDIEDAPEFGFGSRTDYILGMARTEDRVKILIDIDKVMGFGISYDMGEGETAPPQAAECRRKDRGGPPRMPPAP